MSNTSTGMAILFVVIGLIAGGLLVYGLIPRTITETITKTIEVPVEKVIEVPIVTEVSYKQTVADKLLADISDGDYRICPHNGARYDESEITIQKVYDGFNVEEDENGDIIISDVNIKLNYDGGKCYRPIVCILNANEKLSCL